MMMPPFASLSSLQWFFFLYIVMNDDLYFFLLERERRLAMGIGMENKQSAKKVCTMWK